MIDNFRRIKGHISDFIINPLEYARYYFGVSDENNHDRWVIEESFIATWDDRTRIMAQYISPGEVVADFGAGKQALKSMLPENCTYYPYDIIKRTPDTTACDLNISFPRIPDECKVVFFSGLLEYINNIDVLLEWSRDNFEKIIFSYAVSEYLPSPVARRRNGWVNNYSRKELINIVEDDIFSCEIVSRWQDQLIFLAEKK